MQIPYYIVNAFSNGPFTGNPAAVCPLEHWLPESTLQSIASQHNLSETAFFVKEGDGFKIRWFTPTMEVPLCGHATLAAAYVLYHELRYSPTLPITFNSLSGVLKVIQSENTCRLNFPSDTLQEVPYPAPLAQAIGTPVHWGKGKTFFLVELNSEEEVKALRPDFALLKKVQEVGGIIVTAKSNEVDFVSRVFAPQSGIDEDPVTGSAHCLLIPYWSNKLKRDSMIAKQVSQRGGLLFCSTSEDRVLIGGKAEIVTSGVMNL